MQKTANATSAHSADIQKEGRLKPAPGTVAIRMYGQGLGDCFLLAFPRTEGADANDRPYYVVVDSGVIHGTPDGSARMNDVAASINVATGGLIDLLVITHEHWDHLSGFNYAETFWRSMKIQAVWMAWTEGGNPQYESVRADLRKIKERQAKALNLAAQRAVGLGMGADFGALVGLSGFQGEFDAESLGVAGGMGAKGTGDALNIVKNLTGEDGKKAVINFCEPGDVLPLPETGVQAYVLGPPTNFDKLRNLGRHGDTALYDESEPERKHRLALEAEAGAMSLRREARGLTPFNSFAYALTEMETLDEEDLEERDAYERSFPFDATRRIPWPVAEIQAEEERLAKEERLASEQSVFSSYFHPLNGWRRVDYDWLGVAEIFALQADSLTNNTSLVLAFELPEKAQSTSKKKKDASNEVDRKVLLFVADAQVGNWLSWEDIPAWRPVGDAEPTQSKPDIGDLLARTVLYKVGHHGSHNATLKAKGLERMTRRKELTAMVPVSIPVAHEIKDWRRMPFTPMLDDLAQRTEGRVIFPNPGPAAFSSGQGQTTPTYPPGPTPTQAAQLGLKRSKVLLGAVVSKSKGQIESTVPLWTQIAIQY
jgi:hypothetical protein